MNEEILDEIDRYLRKEMTMEEAEAFEQELQKDASLRGEVELTKDIIESLAERRKKLERMKEWDRQYAEYLDEMTGVDEMKNACESAMPRRMVAKNTNRMSAWIVIIGVAACLLVGIFMIRPTHKLDISDVGTPLSNSYRGTFSTHEIQNLITQGKNERALTLIDSLEENYQMEAMQYQDKDSLTDEEAYECQMNVLVLYELEWLRIKALIGGKQYEKAFRALDTYRMREGDYQGKADTLWNELKKRYAR